MKSLVHKNKMRDDLENLILLRKEIRDVASDSLGLRGILEIDSSNKLDILKHNEEVLSEIYDNQSKDELEINEIEVGSTVGLKIDTTKISNYYENINNFIEANKTEVHFDKYYISDLDYFHGVSTKNETIEKYYANLRLISVLTKIADVQNKVGRDIELYFSNINQGLVLSTDYELDKIPASEEIIPGIEELEKHLTDSRDFKERKLIFLNEITALYYDSRLTIDELYTNWRKLVSNFRKSYNLYIAGFSFDKIKTSSEEHFNELTDRIYSSISKFSSYIFGIPVAYIFLIRFFDFSAEGIIKDLILLIMGYSFFALIWFVLLKNIHEAIEAIERDIHRFKEKISSNSELKDIYERLDEQEMVIIPKQKRKLQFVRIVMIVILALITIAFLIIHVINLNFVLH